MCIAQESEILTTPSRRNASQIPHIEEIWSTVAVTYIDPLKSNLNTTIIKGSYHKDALVFCDEILGSVSHNYASAIRQLPPSLLVDTMVFYLVLRALDTIEDDMVSFESKDEKIAHLMQFHKTALVDPLWRMDGVGEGYSRRLLQNFGKCQTVFAALAPKSRSIISDVTQRMAMGMAEFVSKDAGLGTLDVPQYDRYCHFVAGLTGEGLSRLFAASDLEDRSLEKELYLGDQVGLFLQKTNNIQDFFDDYTHGRAFWPQSVWTKYSKTGNLGYFADQTSAENRVESLKCLNELVANALEHVPDSLKFLSKLKSKEILRFCAIPQVMAMATLDKCYNNSEVFKGVVRIRKGLACKLSFGSTNMAGVHRNFDSYARSIAKQTRDAKTAGIQDPSFERIIKACNAICEATAEYNNQAIVSKHTRRQLYQFVLPVGLVLASSGYDRYVAKIGKESMASTLFTASFAFGRALCM